MDPWYWAPIGLAAVGVLRLGWVMVWEEEVSRLALAMMVAALMWTDILQVMHTHNQAPATTQVCTAMSLEWVYDPGEKREVQTWVCTGWSQQ